MSEKHLVAQIKKLGKLLERAQKENSEKKEPLKEKLWEMEAVGDIGSKEYKKIKAEADKIRTISDGTKQTYFDTASAVLKEAYDKFGVTHWKDLTPEHTKQILLDRIQEGQSANQIRKVAHSLDFVQEHLVSSRLFKQEDIKITNHNEMLKIIKDKGIIRHSSDSHRYKATPKEAEVVIKEMEKYNPFLANIARYQLLTGFRVSEAIRQKAEFIHDDRHEARKAKGGLDNVVLTNHHNPSEKGFIDVLKTNADKHTRRIFHRQPDGSGGFKSDEQIRRAVTQLAHRCAEKLGIHGPNGETFSSHSFRGAFGMNRMEYYAANYKDIDQIIADKIKEQPRLKKKYKNFEKRIKDKTQNPAEREIKLYEKIQWLVSTDLNHSRQDIVRYYISSKVIKEALKNHMD